MAKSAKDLTFTSINSLFVFGRTRCHKEGRFLWKVRCFCGNIRAPMSTANLLKYKPNRGCRCPSTYEIIDNLVYVDCSTKKFQNKTCILDLEVFDEYYKGKRISSYSLGTSDLVYASCKGVPVHRLVNGTPPRQNTDHISGNTLDNRRINLRTASKAINGQNCRLNVDNTSGFSGVSYRKDTGKWVAKITVNNKVIWLGTNHITKVSAIIARLTAEMKYNFHENHGRA
ncbi:putative endonuclease subunit [Vibrio phage 501E54-1]|nr:putative endonuclease subunit [Vibrio phage 501E54-1]